MMQTLGIAGIAAGSVIGGMLIKNGRIRVIIVFNLIAIISTLMSIVANETLILVGRGIFGFAAGVLATAQSKVLEETVPSHMLDNGFGSSTNIMINVAVMGCMLIGFGMPDADDHHELKHSCVW